MTTLTYTDVAMHTRSRRKGPVRTAFDRLFDIRLEKTRRYAVGNPVQGLERLDLSDIERRSLFDIGAPERH